MFEMDIEIERNIEKRTTLTVIAVREFAGFEFYCFIFRQESYFRHTLLYRLIDVGFYRTAVLF